MKKETLLVLLDVIVEEKIDQIKNDLPLIRGERGLKGKPGQPFDFQDHKEEIFKEIHRFSSFIYDDFKEKISYISDEEKEKLKVKPEEFKNYVEFLFEEKKDELKVRFADLTDEEKDSLKVRGSRGQKGKGFSFEEHKEEIQKLLPQIEDLKLRFDDLTDEEKDSLTVVGPRGLRGKAGKDFIYEDHAERIAATLDFIFEEKKSDLKLEFSDLTKEEKESLKLKFESLTEDEKQHLKLKFSDLTEGEIDSLKVRGPRGQKGKTIRGEDGATWITGAGHPEITANVNDIYLDIETGDVYKFEFDSWETKGNLKGPSGLSIKGPPGLTGPRGFTGVGVDGEDAAQVIDIEIKYVDETTIYFIFSYDDGSVFETNRIELPQAINSLVVNNNSSVGSGGSTEALSAKRLEITRFADEDIDEGEFVTATSGTNIALAQNNVEAKAVVLGLALNSGVTGEEITVLLFGNYESTGLTYGLNEPVFLGVDGLGSATIPASGWITRIATGNGTDSMFIKIEQPIEI